MKKAVFTIVSKNYISFARTLMDSFEDVMDDYDRYVLLVDENEGMINASEESFNLVALNDIGLPKMHQMIFRYTILELNTAVKPWMYEWVLKQGYDLAYYVDPDIKAYSRFEEIEEAAEMGYSVILTPHLTGRLDDGKSPSELDIMRSGVYNLGFLALKNTQTSYDLLHWWQEKLEYDCVVELERGLFVDQKWMDFAPAMFDDVFILRHEGYNIAYWNLNHRDVTLRNNRYFINDRFELRFFHYSGLNPMDTSNLSKHQDRYKLKDVKGVIKLTNEYAEHVKVNGFQECRNWTYYYNAFSDGRIVTDFVRRAYRKEEKMIRECGSNPYECSDYFLDKNYLGDDMPAITPLMYGVWLFRDDLQKVFTDIRNRDRQNYVNWFNEKARTELGLEDYHLIGQPKVLKDDIREGAHKGNTTWRYSLVEKYGEKVKPILKKVLSRHQINKLKETKESWFYDKYGVPHTEGIVKGNIYPEGVNLIGYNRSEMGIGEACRSTARILQASELDFGIINYAKDDPNRKKDMSFAEYEIEELKYNINIFHINADQLPMAVGDIRPDRENTYNIGIWAWELPELPDKFADSMNYLDEVWGISEFVLDAINEKANIPTYRMPHAIELQSDREFKRQDYNLPENGFMFLSMYDLHSYSDRKNPEASIKAFKKAFDGDNIDVGLVLKINNSNADKEHVKKLNSLIEGYKNIYIIDQIMNRQKINGLLSVVDSVLSLHRSEGFGLVLAEAMYFGKPVVATYWSGNVDFMTPFNSCVVDYKLVKVGKDIGPYSADQCWAEPSTDRAAESMRRLVSDRQYYSTLSKRAKATIKEEYSPEAISKKLVRRLEVIGAISSVNKKQFAETEIPAQDASLAVSVENKDEQKNTLVLSGWIIDKESPSGDQRYYVYSTEWGIAYKLNLSLREDVAIHFDIARDVKCGFSVAIPQQLTETTELVFMNESKSNVIRLT